MRGVAWSIPVVALATHAPAFASSTAAPRPTSLTACKETAGSKCYRFVLAFARPTQNWTITLDSVVLTNTSTPLGEEVISATTPKSFVVSSAVNAPNVFQIQACTTGNLQSAVDVTFVYTATSGSLSETVSMTYQLTGVDPCK